MRPTVYPRSEATVSFYGTYDHRALAAVTPLRSTSAASNEVVGEVLGIPQPIFIMLDSDASGGRGIDSSGVSVCKKNST